MQIVATVNLVAKKSDSGCLAMAAFMTMKVEPHTTVTPIRATVAAVVELPSLLVATR